METPNCPRCKTDEYLKVLDYTRSYTEHRKFRVQGAAISKPRQVAAFVQYRCQKCGHVNGHSVPDSWTLSPESSGE